MSLVRYTNTFFPEWQWWYLNQNKLPFSNELSLLMETNCHEQREGKRFRSGGWFKQQNRSKKISYWKWECDYGFEKHTEGVPQFPAGVCVKGLRGFLGTLQTLVEGWQVVHGAAFTGDEQKSPYLLSWCPQEMDWQPGTPLWKVCWYVSV